MDINIAIFYFSVFLIQLPIVYTPLYAISYHGIGLDKKIEDKKLANILSLITFIICLVSFSFFSSVIKNIIVFVL
jgi:hypothetical protein